MPVLGRARPVRPQIYRGWVEFVVGDANAPAGGPTAAGVAEQPEVTVAPNAGSPTAAGASSGTVANVRALAACPTAVGSSTGTVAHVQALAACPTAAGDATGTTVNTGVDVYPRAVTVATVTATRTAVTRYRRLPTSTIDLGAPVGQPETLAAADCPTAAGASSGTTVQTSTEVFPARTFVIVPTDESVLARRRQATAQFVDLGAPVIQEDVNAQAGCPTAAGTANTAKADIDAKPACPTAAGAATGQTVVTGTLANAACPTAAGSAEQPEVTIGAKPNTPEAAGSSAGTTVETGAFANAPAGCPTAAGSAFTASVTIRPNAAVGLAAGLASGTAAQVGAKPGGPTGAGTAPQATVVFGTLALAGLASANGAANAPKIDLDINAGVAVAAGQAFPVFGLMGNPTGPGEGVIVYDDPAGVTSSDGVGVLVYDDPNTVEVIR